MTMYRSLLLVALICVLGSGCGAEELSSVEDAASLDAGSGDVSVEMDANLEATPSEETAPVDAEPQLPGDAWAAQDAATADQPTPEDVGELEDVAHTSDGLADAEAVADVPWGDDADVASGPDVGTTPKDIAQEDVASPEDVMEDASEPLPLGACCEVHSGLGCATDGCSQAVCALDGYCCETKWDSYCVSCAQGQEAFDGQSCAGLQGVCGCEVPEPEPVSHFELAEHWAPVWFHDTDDTHYEADYIVAYDFDSDTISSNNWENLDEAFVDLGAVIYYAVIETSSHWFIYYLDFHPRDWTEDCDPLIWWVEPCHENDLEGAMVVIRKDGSEHGSFEVLYTEAHNFLHVATNDPNITAASTPNLEDVPVTFEEGSHVQLYVESKGHGVCPLYYAGDSHCEHPIDGNPPAFPGGDGIVYRYTNGVAEQPSSGSDPNVSYKLVSFYDTMWKRRYDICDGACTYDQTMPYAGTLIGETFDGDTWGEDKARPPWSWDDPDDGPVYSGDWFFDPAQTLVTHLSVPGEVSLEYVHNPYVDELWPVGVP